MNWRTGRRTPTGTPIVGTGTTGRRITADRAVNRPCATLLQPQQLDSARRAGAADCWRCRDVHRLPTEPPAEAAGGSSRRAPASYAQLFLRRVQLLVDHRCLSDGG